MAQELQDTCIKHTDSTWRKEDGQSLGVLHGLLRRHGCPSDNVGEGFLITGYPGVHITVRIIVFAPRVECPYDDVM